jgi:drug/metabolite transporter (DMT)-like permease
MTTGSDTAARPGYMAVGYAYVAACFVLVGLSSTLVVWATAPEGTLLVLRFGIACAALVVVFAHRRPLAGVLRRELLPRLLLMGVLDSCTLLAYFFAIRSTGVAVSTFLLFMQPVWVALLAPRILRVRTEKLVFVAVAVAVAGLAVMLVPSLVGGHAHLTAVGVAAGVLAGWAYAGFQLVTKDLTETVPSSTLVIVETGLDTLILLPFGVWQLATASHGLTGHDLLAAVIMGLVCTALAYGMWMEGLGRVPVQHSAVLGFLTPVAAPVFALVLLGQRIPAATIGGGALILAAGLLVMLPKRGRVELEPPL